MTLAEVALHKANTLLIQPPALVLIGEVVNVRNKLDWFSRLPLAGMTFVIARAESDAAAMVQPLEGLGARVLSAPAIRVGPIAGKGPLDTAIRTLERFDWLVFTSGNGVRYFIERLFELGFDLRALGRLKIAAIGPATAARLRDVGLVADLVPQERLGTAFGWFHLVTGLALVPASAGFGLVWERFGAPTAFGVSGVIAAVAAVALWGSMRDRSTPSR